MSMLLSIEDGMERRRKSNKKVNGAKSPQVPGKKG